MSNNTPTYESRLRSVLEVVQAYLPPDGLSSKEAMARIVPLVDPWPDGAPDAANAGEPAAFMWQHEETGNVGFVDPWQVQNGWQAANPRLKIVAPLYLATPTGVAADESARAPDGWRKCEFCGCRTNAATRACCRRGQDADRAAPPSGERPSAPAPEGSQQ